MLQRALIFSFLLSLLANLAFAELPDPGVQPRNIDLPKGVALSREWTEPGYIFTRTPVSLMTSFYDYMIGSFNGLPLRVIPESAGGGYFMTYHGTALSSATRRVYYAHLSSAGNVIRNFPITLNNVQEGYPSLAIDPVSGKPMYAWQANADTEALLETMIVPDAYIDGIDGLWNEIQIAVNNPWTINATTDNEFILPTAIIGPSPITGKRRLYIATQNNVTHASISSENVLIAYADFSTYDIENGLPFVFSYTSIPTLNEWNTDSVSRRRPNYALACDTAGSLYYYGYHTAYDATSYPINEPDIDVFKCPAYGSGTWERYSYSSSLPTWNPPAYPGGLGYFVEDADEPYTNDQLKWKIVNSPHCNAIFDAYRNLHFPAIWGLTTPSGSNYMNLQCVKDVVFNTYTNEFHIEEVYPQNDPSNSSSQWYQPWDTEPPWGVVDEYHTDDVGNTYPAMAMDWNFPYWDDTSHGNAMMYSCSNMKITESNEQNMMAMVWQNSLRARRNNQYADTGYAPYANTPEIFISVSSDNGTTWSDPIVINNIDTPQFAGLKPMWVYPADKIKYVGMQGNQKVGKLGLMFYNDYGWGANAIAPTEFSNSGGQVVFTEIQIVFPGQSTIAMPTFNPTGGTYETAQYVSINCSTPGALIHYTTDGTEPTTTSTLYTAPILISTNTILKARAFITGLIPSLRAIDYYTINSNDIDPWGTPAVLNGSMTVMAQVNINSVPATVGDVLAAFVNDDGIDQLRGKGSIEVVQDVPGCILQVYTENNGEQIKFKVWDISAHTIVPTLQTLTAEVGGVIGSFPNAPYQVNAADDFQVVATPTFIPPAGTYTSAQMVAINCSTAGAQIRYTTDGTEPTATSPLYNMAIYVAHNVTIKAKGFCAEWTPSATATSAYQITGTVPPPTFTPAGGTYYTAQNVTITCNMLTAEIRYTWDGTEPTATSILYGGQISVAVNTTIKARAFLTGWSPSATATATFVITGTVSTPNLTPAGGTYFTAQSVVMTCSTPGAEIRYTTNGTTPTVNSMLYSAPVSVTTSTFVRARGFLTSWGNSATVSATYFFPSTVASPTITPEAGIYTAPQIVTMSCSTPSAQIRYTTDGTEPDQSSTLYSNSSTITVVGTTLFKVKAFMANWIPSATATFAYIITGTVATPTFSPAPGNFNNQVDVLLTCATSDAVIHYTLDGTEPDEASAEYSQQIHLTQTTAIKAKGFKAYWATSETVEGQFNIAVANPEEPNVPVVTGIYQIYPNPFSSSLNIKLGVKDANQAYQVKIYNIKGECVYRNSGYAEGNFELKWNGQSNSGDKLSSGIYLISFTSSSTTQTRKAVLK
ncbi:MAG: hypothetical protein CVU50_02525 [Candidatus Cloacimonetes bacterium HGW-Cloacimonetes-3]|nr:MAG: hypothetical protein CVU50_02525 [Candidatus Cloacimonetes bacterium HGW-Cloacimonetes-3]